MRRLPRLLPLLLSAVAVTACGSTVASGPGTAGGVSTPADGLSLPGSAQSATGAGSADAVGPGGTIGDVQAGTAAGPGPGTAVGSSGAGTTGSGAAGTVPGGSGTAPAAGTDGVGVTKDQVLVGLTYTVGSEAAAAAFGAEVAVGDTKAYYDAVIRHVNRTGGIRGRKLVAVYAKEDAQSADTRDAQDQARCAHFTQDNKVFAVLDSSASEVFLSCVQRTAINIGGFESTGYLESDFQRHRYFFNVNTLTMDEQYGALVPSLQRQKWFGGWSSTTASASAGIAPVVGVLSVDLPQFALATDKVLLPALARAGHPVKPENVVRLYSGKSRAELGRTISEIQNAVLRFRSNGVTHVVIFDNQGGVTLFFAQNADGQKYYPRYGVTTANYLQGLVESGQVPARTANGAMGLGFVPFVDIAARDNPDDGPYSNATRRLCLKIFADASINVSDRNVRAIAVGFCDKVLFFAHAARSVDGPLTRDAFRSAVERIGSSYAVGALEQARFDARHHYATVRGYDMQYDPTCSCVKYVRGFSLD